jgi:hypothetical protein
MCTPPHLPRPRILPSWPPLLLLLILPPKGHLPSAQRHRELHRVLDPTRLALLGGCRVVINRALLAMVYCRLRNRALLLQGMDMWGRCSRGGLVWLGSRGGEDGGTAGGAGLLALEPGAQAVDVEEVAAGELLGSGHLFSADDARGVPPASGRSPSLFCYSLFQVMLKRNAEKWTEACKQRGWLLADESLCDSHLLSAGDARGIPHARARDKSFCLLSKQHSPHVKKT